MSMPAALARWLLACVVFLAAGCATPPRTPAGADATTGPWSGRLALEVEESQRQSFSASFELKGNPAAGELALHSPLGGTLAVLAWAPGSAKLRTNGQARDFESVDALVTHATGAAIPVAALFDWLRGIDTPVRGWRADLSLLGQGRLRAERIEPPPRADLRVILDR
jgi:outer membrane lipoprotein LolB